MLKTCIISLSFLACVISVAINRNVKAINEGPHEQYPRCYLSVSYHCKYIFDQVGNFTKSFNNQQYENLVRDNFHNKSEIIIRHKDYDILETGPANVKFYQTTLPEISTAKYTHPCKVKQQRVSISSVRQLAEGTGLIKGYFAVSTGKSENERIFGKFANVVGKDGKISQQLIKVSGTGILFK